MQEAITKVIASSKARKAHTMDHATEEWVRDTAIEFGFQRGLVKPLAIGHEPWQFCRFEVLGITYEVHDYRLYITNQTR